MHFISTINPMSKSEGNIPVSLFSFNEKLMFIGISEDYEDTIRRVTRAFKIAENADILLRISTLDVCKGREVVIDESAYSVMWTALDEITVVIDEIEAQNQTQVPEASRARETLPTPAVTPTAGQSDTDADPVRIDFLNVVEEAHQSEEEEINEEPVEEPKVTDGEDSFYQPPRSAAPVRELETTGDGEEPKLQKKFKPTGTGSILSDAGPSMTSADIIPAVKKENIVQPIASTSQVPRRERSPQRPNPAPTGDDPRFDITVTDPDNHIAQFKTRGKHPIRKVLAAACKSFSIPYERAHLMLALSFEDDGGMQTEEFECPPEDTMSQCGVDTNSKLFIRVDEDNEEEEPADSD
ncbi:hypothetical protein GALMADRAFT_145180 [Galerina marginata CBS 339.88]|uniref:Uncharacterized protein n=1 Tax=Galerina marginata (strain CBS 339.88) TaxID=685588 RepID=A0A067SFR3_GALM3|nr:hypothetical protein GALMADRAFT_145180 [Galerina marginata CBS 339.88]